MSDGLGSTTWWGFSPALDMQDKDICSTIESLKLDPVSDDEETPFNILVVGAGDCRHVLKTMSHAYRWPKRQLNFYIIENNLETYARDLMLIALASEPSQRMGLQEKTELFLEIYGNSLIRSQTGDYIQKMSNQFIKMVTDFDYLDARLPIVDLSNLKYKERDFLEGIFKFWRNPNDGVKYYDASKCWELRLRHNLGNRYDARKGAFDWDYNFKLAERDADIINKRQYLKWRETGVAFEFRESNYDVPNKTMASGRILKDQEGDKTARRGYWGDIVTSPYITFGIESENKDLFKLANRQHVSTATDVSEFNVLSMLHEIANGHKYEPINADKEAEAFLTEIQEEDEEAVMENNSQEQNANSDDYSAIKLDHAKVFFLPITAAEELHQKSKFQTKFDVVFFSNSMVQHLKPSITSTLNDRALVILETAKFLLEFKAEQIEKFGHKIKTMAESSGCKMVKEYNGLKDAYGIFSFAR